MVTSVLELEAMFCLKARRALEENFNIMHELSTSALKLPLISACLVKWEYRSRHPRSSYNYVWGMPGNLTNQLFSAFSLWLPLKIRQVGCQYQGIEYLNCYRTNTMGGSTVHVVSSLCGIPLCGTQNSGPTGRVYSYWSRIMVCYWGVGACEDESLCEHSPVLQDLGLSPFELANEMFRKLVATLRLMYS